MESINNEHLEIEKEQNSVSGVAVGFALGAFLFWLTIKVVQMVSAI